jgi:uncharacterized protein
VPHANKQMISFFLTTKCNLTCIYCYNLEERKKLEEITLSFEIAKAGIDAFFENDTSRHIRFYGPGEPTCEFELLKSITEYAKEKDKTVSVEIQTNGVFGKQKRKWLLENINIMWLSFDGPPDIQNKNRPIKGKYPSSPIIEENVKWFFANKNKQDIMIGSRVTVTNNNISRQKEMIDYFHNLGIKHIWSSPMFPSVGIIPVNEDMKKLLEYSFDLEKYVDYYNEAYRYAREKSVFYGSFLTCNFDGRTNIHCRSCTPVPHLTPDGFVSACDMVLLGERPYHMDCFIYGKWNSENKRFEYDQNKIENLQKRSLSNMEHCKNCEAKYYCGGYCLGEVVNETGDLFGRKPETCKAIRKLYKAIGPFEKPFEYLHP